MAKLPDWTELKFCGLHSLAQYLGWALTECRRLAVIDGQQNTVKLTSKLGRERIENEFEYFGQLKAEVRLPYDSLTALANGFNFLPAIQEIIPGQAQLPSYSCSSEQPGYMSSKLDELSSDIPAVTTMEQLLYWLCLAYRLNTPLSDGNAVFNFYEQASSGAVINFNLLLPYDYANAIENNIVCFLSEPIEPTNFPTTQLAINSVLKPIDPSTDPLAVYGMGNEAEMNNNANMGN